MLWCQELPHFAPGQGVDGPASAKSGRSVSWHLGVCRPADRLKIQFAFGTTGLYFPSPVACCNFALRPLGFRLRLELLAQLGFGGNVDPPAFRNIDAALRTEAELASDRKVSEQQQKARDELRKTEQLAALRMFHLVRAELKTLEFVVNLKTGQTAARRVASHNDSEDFYSTTNCIDDDHLASWTRVRARDALKWLSHSHIRHKQLNERDLIALPDWLYIRSEEPPAEWTKLSKAARRKSYWSVKFEAIGDTANSFGEGLIMLFYLTGALVGFGFLAYGAYGWFSGIAGLLEFGRRQL